MVEAKETKREPSSLNEACKNREHFWPHTDWGNGERLVAKRGDSFRYIAEKGQYYVFNGEYWEPDETGAIYRLAIEVAREAYLHASKCRSLEQRNALEGHARHTESKARQNAMVENAAKQKGITVSVDQFDKDPLLLNVVNGTIDLRTGKLRPHSREDMLSKCAPIAYDESTKALTFQRFLERILPDADVRAYVQKAIGYSATGDVSEEVLFLPYGSGQNGKSTFLRAVYDLLGVYSQSAPTSLLIESRWNNNYDGPTNDVARLKGARFVSAVETEEGRRLAEVVVKRLTGGDPITARFLNREFSEFYIDAKFWIATNHLPIIRGTDEAIWRRLVPINFGVHIPPEERDNSLREKLRAEYPGILNWIVEGALLWQREGLKPPKAIEDAQLKYRRDQDLLLSFIDEECYESDDASPIKSSIFYGEYETWCKREGLNVWSNKQFSQRLEERGYFKRKVYGNMTWNPPGWNGKKIGLNRMRPGENVVKLGESFPALEESKEPIGKCVICEDECNYREILTGDPYHPACWYQKTPPGVAPNGELSREQLSSLDADDIARIKDQAGNANELKRRK